MDIGEILFYAFMFTTAIVGGIGFGMLIARLTRKPKDRTPWQSYEEYRKRDEEEIEDEEQT
jgi:hypothetical protein